MSEPSGIRIGIDIGGTFTDLQILDERSGVLQSYKTPTTPEDPSIGLIRGITEAGARFGFTLGDVRLLLHGTTIATNAILERRLPRAVLVTTEGFRDVLEIGRHARRDVYGLRPHREPPLIPRDRRIGIVERIRGDGTVEQAFAPGAIAALIETIRALDVETIAVCLLNSPINPGHERALLVALNEALPGVPACVSSEVSPEIREYERCSTTVLNALLMPVLQSYLTRLAGRMAESGMAARLLLVQSNGGVCSAEIAAAQPVRLLLSGPSGGALAALRTAERLARPDLIGVDMGGTSFDVSVVQDTKITLMTQGEIDGLPVRLPMVEIRTIGAGGGSIAAVDAGGRLTVGPRSAGARPGPVCYGRGGTEPTVTDANLVLGRLDGGFFLGGAMALDETGARNAIARRVAEPLALSIEQAAQGLLTVTNVSLAAAIRLSLFEKGLDPRDFSLLSFGGAGGLHAIPVAEELGMAEVIFPPDASTFSAFGILQSDIVHDFSRSRLLRAEPANLAALATACTALRQAGTERLARDGVPEGLRDLRLLIDMRYHGQAFELVVPWRDLEGNAMPDETALENLVADFHALHRRRFSYANPGDPVEIVTVRLAATGRLARQPLQAPKPESGGTALPRRRVFIDGAWLEIPIHRRPQLTAPIDGPALIEEDYTTVYVAAGWRCRPGTQGDLLARRIVA